jgi:hypothetical protein
VNEGKLFAMSPKRAQRARSGGKGRAGKAGHPMRADFDAEDGASGEALAGAAYNGKRGANDR